MIDRGNGYGVSSLEEKHMISLLMYLVANGPSRKIDIYNCVSSNPRMPDKLNHLEEMGLLHQEMDMMSRSTIVTLTERGYDVAGLLMEIDERIRGSVDRS